MQNFATVIEYLGLKVIGRRIRCAFFSRKKDITGHIRMADYHKVSSTIRFNVQGGIDFSKALGEKTLSIVIHEFSHEYADEHDEKFQDALERVGGKMCYVILHHWDHIKSKFDNVRYMPGRTEFVTCAICGDKREVRSQDLHQVRLCQSCQKACGGL